MKRKGGGPSFFYTFLFHFLIALFWFLGSNLLLGFLRNAPFFYEAYCFLDFFIKLYMFNQKGKTIRCFSLL